ncbi:MAG: hypothetical protein WBB28_01805 [Crinalium sp.]
MAKFKFEEFEIELTLLGHGSSYGVQQAYYYYSLVDKAIGSDPMFRGTNFEVPAHRDLIDALGLVLTFLTIQPGDTDPEYFSNYSGMQLDWAKSDRCERLSSLQWMITTRTNLIKVKGSNQVVYQISGSAEDTTESIILVETN